MLDWTLWMTESIFSCVIFLKLSSASRYFFLKRTAAIWAIWVKGNLRHCWSCSWKQWGHRFLPKNWFLGVSWCIFQLQIVFGCLMRGEFKEENLVVNSLVYYVGGWATFIIGMTRLIEFKQEWIIRWDRITYIVALEYVDNKSLIFYLWDNGLDMNLWKGCLHDVNYNLLELD